MPISRKFLDWREPALPQAVEHLLRRYRAGQHLDLDHVVVVVPGSRAGRRLLELIVERCDAEQVVLVPPRIETVGTLPEQLYTPKRPFATDWVQQLAWIHALRSAGRNRVSRVIPQLPHDDDVVRWLALGRMLWRAHRELAAEGLHFGDVVELSWRAGEAEEKARWRVLRRVQELYLRVLDHFELWDLQTARLYAVAHHECSIDKELVLLGTADLNVAMRRMLDQVADRVTALIHAPESLADRFDAHGCILPEAWCEASLPIRDEQVRLASGPADQAAAVAEALASWDGWRRADEITIGVPDESLMPQIRRVLQQCGVRTRAAVGMRMPESGPYRLLQAFADHLDRGRYVDFAALVRHPAMYDYLQTQGSPDGWLTELDRYYAERLQPRLGQWLGPPEECEAARQAWELVERLARPLRVASRKLGQWAQRIIDLVVTIYDDVQLDRDDPAQHYTLGACRQLQAVLLQHQSAPPKLSPVVSCAHAIRLALEQSAAAEIAPLPDDEAVEMLGWLELPLDTAPVLVVAGFNEGRVPTSVNADLFLPNGLRRRLGLLDNERRFARDAYALAVLAESKQSLTLVSGRFDAEGNPLAPSRLLFAVDDDELLTRRALRHFEPDRDEAPPRRIALSTSESVRTRLEIPRPPDSPPRIERLGVTAFRTYLECPYRFYLRHVLGLKGLDDRAEELDGGAFGSLIHDVLADFGRGELAACTDSHQLRAHLRELLEQQIVDRFGDERLSSVNVQLFQLRSRLDAIADWQANWAGQGWRIEHIEADPGTRAAIEVVDGSGQVRKLRLSGRIDRIDRNLATGQWVILDYKTSDSERGPEQTHQSGGEWVDLQLPLYRHLAKPLGVDGDVALGYILLPKDTSRVGERLAGWTKADLVSADETARGVVRHVLAGRFWPPADLRTTWDEYAAICQRGVFDRLLLESADEEEARAEGEARGERGPNPWEEQSGSSDAAASNESAKSKSAGADPAGAGPMGAGS